jgi:hypothetical protein
LESWKAKILTRLDYTCSLLGINSPDKYIVSQSQSPSGQ